MTDAERIARLPEVAGDRLLTSLANFEHRCKVHLAEEQAKIAPDNSLIALLCDGVRLAREHANLAVQRLQIGDAPGAAAGQREGGSA